MPAIHCISWCDMKSLPLVLFSNTSHMQDCHFSHEVITNVALHTGERY